MFIALLRVLCVFSFRPHADDMIALEHQPVAVDVDLALADLTRATINNPAITTEIRTIPARANHSEFAQWNRPR
jgi:hypothetical protein